MARKVQVTVDLGSLRSTPDQNKRLKAYIKNQIVTWLQADVGTNAKIPVICDEDVPPPPKPHA